MAAVTAGALLGDASSKGGDEAPFFLGVRSVCRLAIGTVLSVARSPIVGAAAKALLKGLDGVQRLAVQVAM